MEINAQASSAESLYPVLYIPKSCTTLETIGEMASDVFIDVNIISTDTAGNKTCIYSGICCIKLIDPSDVNINLDESDQGLSCASSDGNHDQIAVSNIASSSYCFDNQCSVWIDPARSPYVFNNCNTVESQERYSFYRSKKTHITVVHNNTYVIQNINNCREVIKHAPADEFEKSDKSETSNQNILNEQSFHDDNEVNYSAFLYKIPREICNYDKMRDRKEIKYGGLENENNAINNPHLECACIEQKVEKKEVVGETSLQLQDQRKYQCDKCKQTFNQITEF